MMPNFSTKFAKLKEDINRLARPFFKISALGGEQDMPFEQAFSNLAHAYLKDKAPTLLDYEIGFQLLDRNQENTKAVGVFGFKVGNQWLYAPVFFLNGDLKGHELLYIKNQDMFVPLKENWLNYILNRRPSILGEGVNKNLSQIGVSQPYLSQLSSSPSKLKYASASPWVKEILPTISYLAITNPAHDEKYKNLINLPTFLKKEGNAVVKSLILSFKENPKLAKSFQDFYDLSIIKEAIDENNNRYLEKYSSSVIKSAKTPKCINTVKGVRCYNVADRKSKSVMEDEPVKSTEINTEPGSY